MLIPGDLRVTTQVLWQGTLVLALLDAIALPLAARRVETRVLRDAKWALAIVTGLFFLAIWGVLASYLFWDPVYRHVFPAWARWLLPPVYAVLFAAVTLAIRWLALRLPGNAVVGFCLLGGLWGVVGHAWGIYRGLLDRPPMLRGASPAATLAIAFVEFTFYWCVIVQLAAWMHRWRAGRAP